MHCGVQARNPEVSELLRGEQVVCLTQSWDWSSSNRVGIHVAREFADEPINDDWEGCDEGSKQTNSNVDTSVNRTDYKTNHHPNRDCYSENCNDIYERCICGHQNLQWVVQHSKRDCSTEPRTQTLFAVQA